MVRRHTRRPSLQVHAAKDRAHRWPPNRFSALPSDCRVQTDWASANGAFAPMIAGGLLDGTSEAFLTEKMPALHSNGFWDGSEADWTFNVAVVHADVAG
mmetsp:Transcript_26840/g.66430  ORF Transcript_26840/g.66430 Transcript_26840/m.66430 type:complete len:99 (-) Transcript_26840:5-301(-)